MKTLLPLLAWLAFLFLAGNEFLLEHWEGALVVFAALALVPMGLELLNQPQGIFYHFTSAGLGAAYLMYPAATAPSAALPYLVLSLWLAIQEGAQILVFRKFQLLQWVRLAALGYWATGALWAFCFLAGIRPLGFDPVIVGLTAAHFHVAGFVVATAVYCLLSADASRVNQTLGWATLAGMPLVATGITLSQLGYSPVFEWASALGFAVFAWAVAWQHLRLFLSKSHPRRARLHWLAGGLCLVLGVLLAAVYALRFHFPISWVNIPNMKVWHGTLQAVGFGWMVLRGWHCATFGKKPLSPEQPHRFGA